MNLFSAVLQVMTLVVLVIVAVQFMFLSRYLRDAVTLTDRMLSLMNNIGEQMNRVLSRLENLYPSRNNEPRNTTRQL